MQSIVRQALQIALSFLMLPMMLCITHPLAAHGQSRAEVFVQLGHTGVVKAVAFSPDGRTVLSGSFDSTARLWEVASGREVRVFAGHSMPVCAVAFSADGRTVLSGGFDGVIKVWEMASGNEVSSLAVAQGGANTIAFSPDGRHALVARRENLRNAQLDLWDVANKTRIRSFSENPNYVSTLAFSADGRYALSSKNGKTDTDYTIKLWSVADGALVKTFAGHTSSVPALAFSPDGRYVISGSSDKTCIVWDVATGNRARMFTGHSSTITAIAVSPRGRYVVSVGNEANSNRRPDGLPMRYFASVLRLWDFNTGAEIKTFPSSTQIVSGVAFAPNGRTFLSGGDDATLQLWDIGSNAEVGTLGGYSKSLRAVAISKDGQMILTGGLDNTLRLWDAATGREIRRFSRHKEQIRAVAFSPDGKSALSGSVDGGVLLWDITSGKNIVVFPGKIGAVQSAAFSPDGRFVIGGGGDPRSPNDYNTLKLWDTATQKDLSRFPGHTGLVNAVAFSPDGRYVVSGGMEPPPADRAERVTARLAGVLKVWEVASGKEVWAQKMSGIVLAAAFSPDGRSVLTSGRDMSLRMWRADSGIEEQTFKNAGMAYTVAFSPDGRTFATGHTDNTLRVWDIKTGREVRKLTGHLNDVFAVAYSPDGQLILSGSQDTTARLWNANTGQEVAKLIGFTDGEWIAVTPEGYYNSSANGDKHLSVRVGDNVYGIDQYRFTFYKPQTVEGVLRRQMAAGPSPDNPAGGMKIVEPPFVVIKSPEDGQRVNANEVDLSIYVEDRTQTIKSVKVYINGRLVTTRDRGLAVKIPEGQKTLDTKIPVRLEVGENLVEVAAFNGYSEGRRAVHLISAETASGPSGNLALPKLWILAIGVNRYDDKQIPALVYPADDAGGIIDAFKSQEGKLFSKVNSMLISDKSATQPTYANIVDNLDFLSRAGQYDVVLLFIAGHGVNDDKGEFFFLPSDAALNDDGTLRRSKAISWLNIKKTLELPAKVLVFVDACYSEGASGKRTRAVDTDRLVKELQEANAVVFTSSRGQELSQESDKWRHGAFTFALIEGLGGKADLFQDGKITMKELDTYVSELVPQITGGAQHPITHTPEGYINFPLVLLRQR